MNELRTICSGQFATVVPKVCDYMLSHDCDTLKHLIQVRFIVGPNVSIHGFAYGASEAMIGYPHDANKPDEFVLQSDDIVEFLDISQDESHENLCQVVSV